MFNSYFLVLAVAFGTSWFSLPVTNSAIPKEQIIESRQDIGSKWVDTWTSMPQLVEPGNLPPSPFVRNSWINIIRSLGRHSNCGNRHHKVLFSMMRLFVKLSMFPSELIGFDSKYQIPLVAATSQLPKQPSPSLLAEKQALVILRRHR
jgi:hypothetical protein